MKVELEIIHQIKGLDIQPADPPADFLILFPSFLIQLSDPRQIEIFYLLDLEQKLEDPEIAGLVGSSYQDGNREGHLNWGWGKLPCIGAGSCRRLMGNWPNRSVLCKEKRFLSGV